MITEAVLGFFRTIVQGILDALPDWDPPDLTGALDAVAPLFSSLAWANKYVPLVECGALFGLFVVFKVGLYVTNFVVWVLTKAHILGGA